MAEHERTSQKKQEKADQKHRVMRKESQPLFDQFHAWEQGTVSIGETPFRPRMNQHAELLARAPSDEHRANLLIHLQQTYGNKYVQRLLNPRFVQEKLTVNRTDDEYEREADRVAQQVMSMTEVPDNPKRVQMQKDEVGSELESRLVANKGGGRPLPVDIRTGMESRFGADFSGVRIHTDREAAQMNRELYAQAFTHGGDIYFGEGKYAPGSHAGKRLLAHELTHVVQQGSARVEANRQPIFGWTQRYPSAQPGTTIAEDDDTDIDFIEEESATKIGWAQFISSTGGRAAIVQRAGSVVFPAWGTIATDSTVKSEADSAWQETLNATTKTTRREQSFWIRWNSRTKAFSATQPRTGKVVLNPKTASVNPGAKPADAGDEYTVGLFHSHTPTRYRAGRRKVGPSPADIKYHNKQDIAGLVYDYLEDRGGYVFAGHMLRSPAKLYDCGPNRRKTKM